MERMFVGDYLIQKDKLSAVGKAELMGDDLSRRYGFYIVVDGVKLEISDKYSGSPLKGKMSSAEIDKIRLELLYDLGFDVSDDEMSESDVEHKLGLGIAGRLARS